MPIYEYRCMKCGEIFELRRDLTDSGSKTKCPRCGSQSPRRIPSVFNSRPGGPGCAPSAFPGST
ncbi:MAG: zinc ribbon domain-containing protein [Dehalococcoidales bacterium]|nr:MAG: zinc ribbon domain-containing protein [Dehalococcoidales bacterium]